MHFIQHQWSMRGATHKTENINQFNNKIIEIITTTILCIQSHKVKQRQKKIHIQALFIDLTIRNYCTYSNRSSRSEVFSNKFTGEHPRRIVISIKLLCNFIEITLRHGCSPVNLLYTVKTYFPNKTYGSLLLFEIDKSSQRRNYDPGNT